MADSTIVTYNLHGFNQGSVLVNNYCSSNIADFMLLQEVWLTPDSLSKIDEIAPGYYCFSVSSMETAVSCGLLKGRPFGGLAILVKNCHRKLCSLVCSNDRLIAIKYKDILLINVYFPCASKEDYKDISIDLIGQLEDLLIRPDIRSVIIGGDFNCTLDVDSWSSRQITELMRDYNMEACTNLGVDISAVNYTYVHESLSHYSYLDYFIVSKNLCPSVCSLEICDDEPNFSDHLPVLLKLRDFIKPYSVTNSSSSQKAASSCFKNRWDHADLLSYYELTRLGLQPLLETIRNSCSELHNSNSSNVETFINSVYYSIVCVLHDAARQTVPRIKVNALKFWWDQELQELKQQSVASHKLWVDAGRPRSGNVFVARNQHRRRYKLTIKNRKRDERESFTNDLHDSLLNKNMGNFWNVWNSKFSSHKHAVPTFVDGFSDPEVISEKFGEFFANACSPDERVGATSTDKLPDEFSAYVGDTARGKECTVEMLDEIICSMPKGKAAGIDNLTIEHIQYSHPIIVILLKELFNCMMLNSVIPKAFGQGLTIPLVKDGNVKTVMSVENFRGITVSPVISKLFEHLLLRLFSSYFVSNEAQFGFKKGLGCAHAIFSVKQIVDYYVRGGSTMNICTLDISKAFDKLNFNILIQKLMNRNVPRCIIKLLFVWFTNSYIRVKWLDALSSSFLLRSGVRQGGVLSPVLFAVYVNSILHRLNNSKVGCFVKGLIVNVFMYADDLIILSASVTGLQYLLKLCVQELDDLKLTLNVKKCFCIRVGKRFASPCQRITIGNIELSWVNELRYLGVYLLSGHTLKFSLDYCKKKFYRCLNCILSKTGNKPDIVLSLCQSYCTPVLLYCVETMNLTDTEKKRLSSPFTKLFNKLFWTFDKSVIAACHYYTSYLPLSYIIDLKILNFLVKCRRSDNSILRCLHGLSGDSKIDSLLLHYNLMLHCKNKWKAAMWKHFVDSNNLDV